MAKTLEQRMQELEDREAIRQAICGYGYAMDGCNAEAVGAFYTDDGVYAVGDIGAYEGRAAVEAITASDTHLALVEAGCAHISTPPYIVRLSASRIELARQADGAWKIVHRQNRMQDGSKEGPALLARLNEGPMVP